MQLFFFVQKFVLIIFIKFKQGVSWLLWKFLERQITQIKIFELTDTEWNRNVCIFNKRLVKYAYIEAKGDRNFYRDLQLSHCHGNSKSVPWLYLLQLFLFLPISKLILNRQVD